MFDFLSQYLCHGPECRLRNYDSRRRPLSERQNYYRDQDDKNSVANTSVTSAVISEEELDEGFVPSSRFDAMQPDKENLGGFQGGAPPPPRSEYSLFVPPMRPDSTIKTSARHDARHDERARDARALEPGEGHGTALCYTAAHNDPIDQAVEAQTKLLPSHLAKCLIIRRVRLGEYEVDGHRVSIAGADKDFRVSTGQAVENLGTYLRQVAEFAYGVHTGGTAICMVPMHLRLSFPAPGSPRDQNVDHRFNAMQIAKKQAALREQAAEQWRQNLFVDRAPESHRHVSPRANSPMCTVTPQTSTRPLREPGSARAPLGSGVCASSLPGPRINSYAPTNSYAPASNSYAPCTSMEVPGTDVKLGTSGSLRAGLPHRDGYSHREMQRSPSPVPDYAISARRRRSVDGPGVSPRPGARSPAPVHRVSLTSPAPGNRNASPQPRRARLSLPRATSPDMRHSGRCVAVPVSQPASHRGSSPDLRAQNMGPLGTLRFNSPDLRSMGNSFQPALPPAPGSLPGALGPGPPSAPGSVAPSSGVSLPSSFHAPSGQPWRSNVSDA